ncbi:MAG: hypothetical protein KC443_04735 [Anaerolineales bacterium]|nr:hypothetical protein [Anaerolineales bacterium]
MKFYGNAAKATAEKIVEAFKSGNVPQPLAQVFIKRDVPMMQWSVLNQFGCILSGCTDARGFKQWQEADRHVKKGEKAASYILVPLRKTIREENEAGEAETRPGPLYGFKGIPVFDVSQTEGEPLPEMTNEQTFIDNLPLLAVAQAFGLKVHTFDGRFQSALGLYSPARQFIALGVENLSTWFHELIHAADDRAGNLTEKGQHWRSEVVAELGGATLACMIGMEESADVDGAWKYVERYAIAAEIEPITACIRVLERIAQAIELILETALRLERDAVSLQVPA